MGTQSTTKTQNDSNEQSTTRFRVVIPNQRGSVHFKSCEGLESEVEVNYLFEGGRNGAPRTARGKVSVNKITFGGGNLSGEGGGKALFDWYVDVCNPSKPLSKLTLSVILLGAQDQELSKWKLINAWPCRWMGPILSKDSNNSNIEYISFAHEGVQPEK